MVTDNMKETYISLLEILGMASWVEIATDFPRCTYFFGPFANISEAEEGKYGYIEDLEAEDAKPEELTIYDQSIDVAIDRTPSLSGHSH
jgi:hypothetical protein